MRDECSGKHIAVTPRRWYIIIMIIEVVKPNKYSLPNVNTHHG